MENLKSDKFDDDTKIAIDVHDLMVLFLIIEDNQGQSSKFYVMGATHGYSWLSDGYLELVTVICFTSVRQVTRSTFNSLTS